jgi:pimeloyl-ACP methyl ester carboxylesterase
MTKLIEVEVGGVSARFALREDLSPRTAAALWESLPIEGPLRHAMRSGEACYCHVSDGPLTALPERPELPLMSIYQGWLVVHPDPNQGRAELLISYGLAEYHKVDGRGHVCPVAEIQGDASEIFGVLARTHREGESTISIRRV